MKLAEKMKSLAPKLSSRKGKIIGFSMLIAGSVGAVTMTTLAWFNLTAKESKIKMVTGDLDVEINKVSAYKYVYPYYKNSTEFIDYDAPGVVKKYVLEDHTLTYGETDVDDINITSDNATVTLGTRTSGTSTTTLNDASSTNVYIPDASYVPSFHYYLIGDGLFNGVDESWSLDKSQAFGLRESVTAEKHAILDNIVVSAGSSFALNIVDKSVVKRFEEYYQEKHGEVLKVEYRTFSTPEEMYSKLKAGSVKADLICPSDYMIQKMANEGRLEKFSFSEDTGKYGESLKNFEDNGSQFIKDRF